MTDDKELIARLRQVRRYRLVNEPGYQGQMLVRSDGKYVLHTDYVALLEQLAAARQDAKEAEAYAEELEAKLAKAVKLIDLAVELARWGRAPKLRDDMIDFTTEIKGESHE